MHRVAAVMERKHRGLQTLPPEAQPSPASSLPPLALALAVPLPGSSSPPPPMAGSAPPSCFHSDVAFVEGLSPTAPSESFPVLSHRLLPLQRYHTLQ